MGWLSEVEVLGKAVGLFSPYVSSRISCLGVQESADRLGPWCVVGGSWAGNLKLEPNLIVPAGKNRKSRCTRSYDLSSSRVWCVGAFRRHAEQR